MDSLYGGKPGTPFVIKKGFSSTDEMVEEFGKGAGYTGVWYGEYCIIDTVNKNDKTNGCIYRRGYTSPEYIGQIIGPKGGLGNFKVTTLDETAEYLQSSLFVDENGKVNHNSFRNYPAFNGDTLETNWYNDNGVKSDKGFPASNIYKKQEYRKQGLTSDVAIQEFNTQSQSLVPGATLAEDGSVSDYNDSIRWNYCNVRLAVDENGNPVDDDHDTWMHIGFEFPYSVFNFSSTKVKHYKDTKVDLLKDIDEHPYYWPYNIDIPAGRPGQDVVDVWIEEYDPDNKHHDVKYIKDTSKSIADFNVKKGHKIWLCTLKSYVNEREETSSDMGEVIYYPPEETTYFIGEYKGIHGQDVVSVYLDDYDPDVKHKNLKKINNDIAFPAKGRKIWICVLRNYDDESELLGQAPLETEYYVCAYDAYHGRDVVSIWKEKYLSKTKDTDIIWPEGIEKPSAGAWIWLTQIRDYENESVLLDKAPEVKTYFVGADTSILLHSMWKEKYLGNDKTATGEKINWPVDIQEKPAKDTWIWLYKTKDSIDDADPLVYYAGIDTSITNVFKYDFDSIIPGDKPWQDYLIDLNNQDNSEYQANAAIAYSYDGIIHFFAYDGQEWYYSGKLGVELESNSYESLTLNDFGFLGKLK